MQGDYFFLPLEHVIFGAGSLERLPGELERLKVLRALIITGQSLATKTGIVSKVEETLGPRTPGLLVLSVSIPRKAMSPGQ